MRKVVYWASRHNPLPSQEAELKRLLGKVEIIVDPQPFGSADDIISRAQAVGADEIVVVAPLSVIAALCQRGIKPLWAEMEAVNTPEEGEVEVAGRFYRFKRFRRIKGVVIDFEDL